MKRWTPLAALLAASLMLHAPVPCQAQVTGQYTGAQLLTPGGHLFGGYLDVSSNVVGLMAQLRLCFYPGVEFGFQGGPSRNDLTESSRGTVRLGTDVRVATMQTAKGAPFDLALGGELGVENGDNFSVISLGPTGVVSRIARGNSAGGITPYLGAALLFSNIDVGSRSETDFSVPLRLGSEFSVTPAARLMVELEIRFGDSFRDNAAVNVGLNAPF
ncbi:MAG: hypothetical protein ACRENS_01065 [Candidatus Eiseniibacteriota bacterium]